MVSMIFCNIQGANLNDLSRGQFECTKLPKLLEMGCEQSADNVKWGGGGLK